MSLCTSLKCSKSPATQKPFITMKTLESRPDITEPLKQARLAAWNESGIFVDGYAKCSAVPFVDNQLDWRYTLLYAVMRAFGGSRNVCTAKKDNILVSSGLSPSEFTEGVKVLEAFGYIRTERVGNHYNRRLNDNPKNLGGERHIDVRMERSQTTEHINTTKKGNLYRAVLYDSTLDKYEKAVYCALCILVNENLTTTCIRNRIYAMLQGMSRNHFQKGLTGLQKKGFIVGRKDGDETQYHIVSKPRICTYPDIILFHDAMDMLYGKREAPVTYNCNGSTPFFVGGTNVSLKSHVASLSENVPTTGKCSPAAQEKEKQAFMDFVATLPKLRRDMVNMLDFPDEEPITISNEPSENEWEGLCEKSFQKMEEWNNDPTFTRMEFPAPPSAQQPETFIGRVLSLLQRNIQNCTPEETLRLKIMARGGIPEECIGNAAMTDACIDMMLRDIPTLKDNTDYELAKRCVKYIKKLISTPDICSLNGEPIDPLKVVRDINSCVAVDDQGPTIAGIVQMVVAAVRERIARKNVAHIGGALYSILAEIISKRKPCPLADTAEEVRSNVSSYHLKGCAKDIDWRRENPRLSSYAKKKTNVLVTKGQWKSVNRQAMEYKLLQILTKPGFPREVAVGLLTM